MRGRVNEYGRFLRVLRIKNDEVLLDMARKLGITSSYLSAIENGKREIPEWMSERIVSLYKLDDGEIETLKKAEEHSITQIKIDLQTVNSEKQELAFAFARKLENMDNETIRYLRERLMK